MTDVNIAFITDNICQHFICWQQDKNKYLLISSLSDRDLYGKKKKKIY